MNLNILYEDNHLIVVNKPSGILSQGDITGDDCIIDIGKEYIRKTKHKTGNVFLGLPHRLDRPSSGALVLCRTSKSLSRMTALFRERSIDKGYTILVSGRLNNTKGVLSHYLKKNPRTNTVLVRDQPFKDAKIATLSYELLSTIGNNSLVAVQLHTGRPHQIRAQFSNIGCPVLGDLKYGASDPLKDKSIALHCRRLSFIHPVSKKKLEILADYPCQKWWKDFTS